jgi:tRNA A-37 threonylcarbamoyl transferase component Bud32
VSAAIAGRLEQRWRIQTKGMSILRGMWRYSRQLRPDDPPQGWKIHVSATPLSAGEVLSRVLPILAGRDVLFKVPARLELLVQLNIGIPAFCQVGKFLTIYPRSTAEAVDLARKLGAATRKLHGPEVPFDECYRKRGLIYYRYGSFLSSGDSAERGIIVDHRGKSYQDKRTLGYAVPRWLDDPFQKPRTKFRRSRFNALLGNAYLPFKLIAQRGKGGVYEAVDLSVSPARQVIIKEGRRHGETTWDGQDGYARVKHEGRVLRALHAASLPVPKILKEFTQGKNRYLALEKIAGRPLIPRHRAQPARTSPCRAEKILVQLGELLSMLHAVGWVWRDCKPSHVFLHRGEMRLIDFEGACRIAETDVLSWGSMEYVPPELQNAFSRHEGVLEDDYALGVIAFQFATGEFPPSSSRRRAAMYRRAGCTDVLRGKIENLLTVPS